MMHFEYLNILIGRFVIKCYVQMLRLRYVVLSRSKTLFITSARVKYSVYEMRRFLAKTATHQDNDHKSKGKMYSKK